MDANRSRGIAVGVFALMAGFGFQGAEDALHRCVVPAVWLAAHRWGDGGGLQDVAIIAGGIVTAAIRVMDQARPRTAPLDGHGQCGHGKFGAHMLAHRLVLQPGLVRSSSFPMASASSLLVAATPARPGACGLGVRRPGPDQQPEQASHFRHGDRQQIGLEIEHAFFSRRWRGGLRRDRHAPASPG